MGNVLSYSGLSTKIRAMQSKLITEEQLREMVQLPSVSQAVAYLKRTPQYAEAWASVDENSLHRGQIEKMLRVSTFSSFSRIYRFANNKQRRFLDLYVKRYEIRVLKDIMTNLFDHRDTDPLDLSPYRDFFRSHFRLDLDVLSACTSMEEFIGALKGNEFYFPLSAIKNRSTALLFDYGMALDLYYFTQIWEVHKKLFRGKDLQELTLVYGEKFDMLNLQFIQRSKQYFNMSPVSIYALLIPMKYKLTEDEIAAMVNAATPEDFMQIFGRTYYGKKYEKLGVHNLEEFYNQVLRSILEKEAREDPYSVAVLYSYLYRKEHEITRLTIAIECIRYGVAPDEAIQYIHNN